MPIQAQTVDGVVHQFPDGTDRSIIDTAMKKYTMGLPPEKRMGEGSQDIVDQTTGMAMPQLAHAATVPIEAAKGVPVAGALVPDTKDTKQFEQDQPGLAAATRGVGAAISTAPAIAMAPGLFGLNAARGLVGNTLMGAASGGAISAADAKARGENVLENATTGAITGGIAPGVGKVFGAVLNWLSPAAKGILKGFNPKALEEASYAAKADGLTDQQVAEKLTKLGPEGFLAEYSPRLKGAAAGVASGTGGGPGKEGLIKGFEERVAPEAVNQRVTSGLDKMLGKPENLTQRTIEDIEERGKTAGPLFNQWKSSIVQPTPELKAIVEGLEEHGFMKEANELATARTLAGKDVPPMKDFFTTGERKGWPTAESYGYLRRAIVNRMAGEKNPDLLKAWKGARDRLDAAIENSNQPAAKVWKQARDEWGTRSEILKARDAGTSAWDAKLTPDQLVEDLTNMTTAERAAYKEGARAALAHRMEASANGDTNVRNLLRSEASKRKMHMLAENKQTSVKDVDEFLNQMEREATYGQSSRELGTNTQKEATKEMKGRLTPDPSQTGAARAEERMRYGLHITPSQYLLPWGSIKDIATRRQAAQFERARDDLGKILSKKGSDAADMARALLNYKGPQQSQAAMNTAGIVRQLLQPSLPGTPVTNPF